MEGFISKLFCNEIHKKNNSNKVQNEECCSYLQKWWCVSHCLGWWAALAAVCSIGCFPAQGPSGESHGQEREVSPSFPSRRPSVTVPSQGIFPPMSNTHCEHPASVRKVSDCTSHVVLVIYLQFLIFIIFHQDTKRYSSAFRVTAVMDFSANTESVPLSDSLQRLQVSCIVPEAISKLCGFMAWPFSTRTRILCPCVASWFSSFCTSTWSLLVANHTRN